MTFVLVLKLLLHAPLAQSQTCSLPKYEPPKEWQACVRDTDCILASDPCRYCENFIPVNRMYTFQATEADLEKRLASKCIKKCEPKCDPRSNALKCIDSYCTVVRVKVPPPATDAGKP